jgi:transmembrane sensor
MSSEPLSNDATIREQAALWAARLNDSDIAEAEREELQRWLLADVRHANEFRAHNAILALARDLPADLHKRLSTFAPSYGSQPARRWMWPSALAAALLLALITGGWFVLRPSLLSQSYATDTGQTRTVTFDDGSVAYLNTRTQLKWLGGRNDRRVALLEGEALFDVIHDPAHPFTVVLGNSEIHVLGTRFNVYRKKDGETVVTVLEGAVAVSERGKSRAQPAWQRRLSANQQITYRPLGLLNDVHETAAEKAVKWREGVLEIQDQPIAAVLDELTRYTDQRIVIRDPRIADFRVGGALSVRDVRVALARLEKLAPLDVEESGGTFTLDYRTEQ